MEECLISIGAKIAEYTVEPVGHQLGYLCFYKRNIDDLKAQIKHLGHAEQRLQRRADDAKRNGEDIEADVKELLNNVRKIIEDSEKFIREEEQANTKCCTGAFPIPNLVLRYQLSRRAKKKTQDAVSHITSTRGYDNQKISFLPHKPNLEVKGYEGFESRNRILTEIMKAVRDPDVRVLGVWGMGGVGKTMLTKEVAARLAKDEEKPFSEVVFTTISATLDIEKIQEEIRKCLGMDKQDDIGERIKNRLMKENNILVIVDDVWEKIELEDVGISFGKDHKGCKILVTTRYQNVLNNMDVDKIFPVGVLLEDEAMNLFSKIVGDKAKEHDFQALATEIVKECGGLPIAITTVASALKSSPRYEVWKNALNELRESDPVSIAGMDKKVYSSIKLSYNFLQSEEAKKLLLLCSLFEEDAEIPVELLCHYGIGLKGISKLGLATNKTITLVETLKDHSLLLSGSREGDNFVRLHDVISIACKDVEEPMYNFRDAVEWNDFPVTEKLKKSTAISLCHIKSDGYPETLRSPKLKLLRLISWDTVEFQHHFFEGLDQLFVLDLKGVSLKPSPASSFCLPQNLQTLRLIDCDLGDISWIGELNNLKILDLSYSNITELPKEIGKLNRMLSLNLQGCQGLRVIPPNVISRLTRLEELNLYKSFENREDDERPNASLVEVKNLGNLTNLSLTVPDVNILPNNMFSDKLDKFNIQIGIYVSYVGRMSSRILTLKLCPDSVLKEHDFEVLLKRSQLLHLIGLKSAKNVAYELDSMGFPQLEQLIIDDSTEILCILNSNGNTDNRAAFGKLRELSVNRCHKMKSLFPIYNIPKQLESISVRDCEMMEEIVSDGREGDGDLLKISELRVLELDQLPKLVQFKATRKSDDSVVPFFNGEVLFPKLEQLTLRGLNVGKIWNGDQLRSSEFGFKNIRELIVFQCHELKGVIPSFVARSLVHLQYLRIGNCKAMEEVVFMEESTQEAKAFENISFPKLKTLRLIDLPNLKRFYAGDYINIDCPSLLKLVINNCPKLRELIPTNTMQMTENENFEDLSDQVDKLLFNHKVLFLKLEELTLDGLNVGKIWNGDQLRSSEFGFKNIMELIVFQCHELKGVIPSSVARSLVHLEYLRIDDCKAMEEVVFMEESTQEAKAFENISFPKLKTLRLIDLPNLKRFYAGDYINIDCPSLLKLVINNCPKLRELIPTNTMQMTENENFEDLSDQVDKLLFNHKVLFLKLEELTLDRLNVGKIWNGDQLRASEFGFQSLRNLIVNKCDQLKGLIPSSMARSVVHLEYLRIDDCKAIEEVVFMEESTQEAKAFENISFPKLKTLILIDLPNLKRFYAGDYINIDCPSLLELEINNCPKLRELIPTNTMPMTENENFEDLSDQVDKLLFNHKVLFLKLEDLTLDGLNVGKIWNGNQLRSSEFGFQSLRYLIVNKCDQLKGLIPSSMARSLVHLEYLRIDDCKAIEEVVFMEESTQEAKAFENISFPKLKTLILIDLPNLKRFYAGDYINIDCPSLLELEINNCPKLRELIPTNTMPMTENENFEDLSDQVDKLLFNHKVLFLKLEDLTLDGLNVGKIWNGNQLRSSEFGFQSLRYLIVNKCDQLKGLIPSSMARSLVHLEYLRIDDCKAMEEVVFMEESTQEAKAFENISFPKLKTLRLINLPNLKRIYAGDYINIDCPSLLELKINNCPKLRELIPTDTMPMKENENFEDLSDQVDKLLFNHKVLLPNLEQLHKIFENVETLEIFKCDGLKVFAPPSMSLQSLTILKVKSCNSLTGTLFPRSIAKSLSQLRELSIFRCPNLRQVIANDNKEAHDDLGEIADDIVFSQLETLILIDLSSLEIFYFGDSVLKFPRLEKLVVDHCLGMKTFSHGNIEYCSMLNKIVGRNKSKQNDDDDDAAGGSGGDDDDDDDDYYYDDYYYDDGDSNYDDDRMWAHRWEGDINTTIQRLWKDENDSSLSEENMENA